MLFIVLFPTINIANVNMGMPFADTTGLSPGPSGRSAAGRKRKGAEVVPRVEIHGLHDVVPKDEDPVALCSGGGKNGWGGGEGVCSEDGATEVVAAADFHGGVDEFVVPRNEEAESVGVACCFIFGV